jgi:CubicO group peptidase (beta-lactamase class C family)
MFYCLISKVSEFRPAYDICDLVTYHYTSLCFCRDHTRKGTRQSHKESSWAGQYQSLIIAYIQDGETLIRAYGTLQVGSDAQPNTNTLFELSSNSKTFAGSLLALLAARGEISLDDPVNLYLPDSVEMATFNEVEVSNG